jgi:anti-sigma regulatory factor (Ser/Thr protein kinase)
MAQELNQQYPASVTTPALARRHIAAYLDERSRAELIPTATLLVSELVTNSVIHAAGPIQLRAQFAGPTLHVEVVDHSSELPRLREPGNSGRGLHIVDALAAAWGVNTMDGHGKATWFDLNHD